MAILSYLSVAAGLVAFSLSIRELLVDKSAVRNGFFGWWMRAGSLISLGIFLMPTVSWAFALTVFMAFAALHSLSWAELEAKPLPDRVSVPLTLAALAYGALWVDGALTARTARLNNEKQNRVTSRLIAESKAPRILASTGASRSDLLTADRQLHSNAHPPQHLHHRAVTASHDSARILLRRGSSYYDLALTFLDAAPTATDSMQAAARHRLIQDIHQRRASYLAAEERRRRTEEHAARQALRYRLRTNTIARVAFKCGLSESDLADLADRVSTVYWTEKRLRVSSGRVISLLDRAVPLEAAPTNCTEAAAVMVAMTG